MLTLNGADFAAQVLAAKLPVLVEFSAPWCAPCRRMELELAELAAQWQDKARVVRVDVDQVPEIAAQFGVLSVPTLVLFVSGEARQRVSGYQPRQKIVDRFLPEIEN